MHFSDLVAIQAGMPQGLFCRAFLFILCINGVLKHLGFNILADDTSLYIVVTDPKTDNKQLNSDMTIVFGLLNQ